MREPVSEKRRSSSTRRGKTSSASGRVDADLGPLEPERVLDDNLRVLERVAAARDVLDHVAAAELPAGAFELDLALPEALDPLDRGQVPRRHASLELENQPHRHVVAGDVLARDRPLQAPRSPDELHPGEAEEGGEHEPDGHRVERLRAERPAGKVREAAQGEREATAIGQHR